MLNVGLQIKLFLQNGNFNAMLMQILKSKFIEIILVNYNEWVNDQNIMLI